MIVGVYTRLVELYDSLVTLMPTMHLAVHVHMIW